MGAASSQSGMAMGVTVTVHHPQREGGVDQEDLFEVLLNKINGAFIQAPLKFYRYESGSNVKYVVYLDVGSEIYRIEVGNVMGRYSLKVGKGILQAQDTIQEFQASIYNARLENLYRDLETHVKPRLVDQVASAQTAELRKLRENLGLEEKLSS
ncbi:MAG TPA: hypothetical protein VJJ75_00775 [Candidatus Nanoarchaeia archaeon]|nr:hypothetical protein [Candidatus Nanoarchaeia archaeon]